MSSRENILWLLLWSIKSTGLLTNMLWTHLGTTNGFACLNVGPFEHQEHVCSKTVCGSIFGIPKCVFEKAICDNDSSYKMMMAKAKRKRTPQNVFARNF